AAKADTQLTFVVWFFLVAHDHIALVRRYIKIAVESGRINFGAKALYYGLCPVYFQRTKVISFKIAHSSLPAIAAYIAGAAERWHKHVKTEIHFINGFRIRPACGLSVYTPQINVLS